MHGFPPTQKDGSLRRRGAGGRGDIRLKATKKAIQFIATQGFDPQFGAWPIKRVIQKNVLNELSKLILEGNVKKENEIVMDEKDGKLVFRNS
jgi:ATP-dependent Clp protease ATP-binding subunit ClpB